MKKCPFCKAEIEENARFCIYCMTSLEQKTAVGSPPAKKRNWWWIPVGLILLLGVAVFALWGEAWPAQGESSLQGEALPEPLPKEDLTEEPPTESAPVEQTQPIAPEENQTAVIYSYRLAERYDELNVDYFNDGNDIVITGVEEPAADGVYEIPSHIDGKRVIAITAGAFSEAGSNAKKVVLPETVKCVWDHSFRGCALEQIYFTHNVYIQTNAFPDSTGILTIYCPQDCHDRLFWSYSGHADSYGATWEEWDG